MGSICETTAKTKRKIMNARVKCLRSVIQILKRKGVEGACEL